MNSELRELSEIIARARRSTAKGESVKISVSDLSRRFYCVAMRDHIATLHPTRRNPIWLSQQFATFQKQFWFKYINEENPEVAARFLGWTGELSNWVRINALSTRNSENRAIVVVRGSKSATILVDNHEWPRRGNIGDDITHVAVAWRDAVGVNLEEPLWMSLGPEHDAVERLKEVCRKRDLMPDSIVQYPAILRASSDHY